jgi:uncharacterized protein (DUF58 family)
MQPSKLSTALEKARLIEIRTRRAVEEQLAGGRRSVFRGRGMDFEEVREYVPGDDVRSIDWSVTARAGKPFVKKYREERELTLMLVVDVSASGDFGSGERSKRELAAELASVLALSTARTRDKVGLLTFSESVEHFIGPGSGRGHVLRLVNAVLSSEPRGRGTNVAGALDHVSRFLHRRATVVVLSDFQVPSAGRPALARTLHGSSRRHDLTALWLRDPHEIVLPNVGVLTIEDAETGELIVLDTGRSKLRRAFEAAAAADARAVDALLRGSGARVLELSTHGDYVRPLLQFFSARAQGGTPS